MSTTSTRRGKRPKFRRKEEKTSLQLIEEAFQLIRLAPASSIFTYALGTIPFVLALFYFWADMSRSSFALKDSPVAALGMVIAYFWMKGWHAVFCRQLYEQINPGNLVQFSRWQKIRYFAAQVFLHAFATPILAISLFLLIPLPWTYAFFKNVSALGLTQDYRNEPLRNLFAKAGKFSLQNFGQSVGILAITKIFALFVFLNFLTAIGGGIFLLKSLFDIETVFSINPIAAFTNSTFLFSVVILTFLCMSPLMTGIYVLRCFYQNSQSTGADLLSRLAMVKAERQKENGAVGGARKRIALLAGIGFFLASSVFSFAQENGSESGWTELDNSIRDTMSEKKYQWRFERLELEPEAEGEESEAEGLMNEFANSIKRFIDRVENSIDNFFDRLSRKSEQDSEKKKKAAASGDGDVFMTALNGLFIAAVVLLLIWLIYLLAVHYNRTSGENEIESGSAGPIDLESESIVATQLQEDEWIALAREQIAAGDTRLALRALFLASLAHLGDREMLRVQKFKSNSDYSRELEMRARSLPELQAAFKENVGLFERVWYGLHSLGDEAVEHFTGNYERIAALKTAHELRAEETEVTA